MSEALLGGDSPVEETTTTTTNDVPNPSESVLQEIYGDLAGKIQWPEGVEDDVKTQAMLKPFVDNEGKLRHADLLKSYVHAQKQIGKKGVIPPTEHSPKEEWDSYFEKVGFKSNPAEYDVGGKLEGLDIPDDFYNELKTLLHSNRVPLEAAKQIKGFFESQTKKGLETNQSLYKQELDKGVTALKEEWGVAFSSKVALAKDFINELAEGDENTLAVFNDPAVGSNPAIVKLVAKMAERHYGEDKIKAANDSAGAVSPEEAQEQINELMANPVYWDSDHPQYRDLQKKVDRLYKMKNGQRA